MRFAGHGGQKCIVQLVGWGQCAADCLQGEKPRLNCQDYSDFETCIQCNLFGGHSFSWLLLYWTNVE